MTPFPGDETTDSYGLAPGWSQAYDVNVYVCSATHEQAGLDCHLQAPHAGLHYDEVYAVSWRHQAEEPEWERPVPDHPEEDGADG